MIVWQYVSDGIRSLFTGNNPNSHVTVQKPNRPSVLPALRQPPHWAWSGPLGLDHEQVSAMLHSRSQSAEVLARVFKTVGDSNPTRRGNETVTIFLRLIHIVLIREPWECGRWSDSAITHQMFARNTCRVQLLHSIHSCWKWAAPWVIMKASGVDNFGNATF